MDIKDLGSKLVDDFKWYFDNKYITPRDGNACIKIDSDEYVITPSGVQKQSMSQNLLLRINGHGELIEKTSLKPSIEAHGHLIAMALKNKSVSVHVHSMNTVALFSLATKKGFLNLLEENFRAQWPELFRYTKLGQTIPFLQPGSQALHDGIKKSFQDRNNGDIVVLDRHGIITLGESLEECKEHIQRLEHVSEIALKMLMASNGDTKIFE